MGDPHASAGPSCCMPGRVAATANDITPAPSRGADRDVGFDGMAVLSGGEFLMGTDDAEGFPSDGEGPIRPVRVDPFAVDTRAVDNARFAEFVAATGYVTEAERIGWSYVFAAFVPAALRRGGG
ncbi:SUMF1/EgtB/PvdO family nonheme iron enzyme, partial [Yinghuangia sp. YIM S09857]|uniref:SUMF1/EgtB/PvdO family nonheme iron enzyme n=1 Tax=Yinghuangia sp. YIM S09857 TaxID=3436929 RepID=UPI003F52C2E8